MGRRPRSVGGRAGRGGGRVGGSITPPAPEVPLTISGLKCWFDTRSTDYFALGAGNAVGTWMSRPEGSLGGIAWLQGNASNQAVRVASVATLNGMPAVLFDGVNDWFQTTDQNAWTFLHNGSGQSCFLVYRLDATGGSNQWILMSQSGATDVGIFVANQPTAFVQQVANGTGVLAGNWTNNTPAHSARDVSRWQLTGYAAGVQHSRVSGSSLTGADIGGPPSAANPTRVLRLGATSSGTSPLKGVLAQKIVYDRVPTAGETTLLANWAASLYGVAA